jgi:nucleotide-binding universal stress UspA family protein
MVPAAELPVVVGVDGSPSSVAALDLAAAEAALRECALQIVYVREPADTWHTVGRRAPVLVDPELAVAEAGQRAADRHPRLAVESAILDGLPSVVLIEQSRWAGLTVVGHQGGGGFLGRAPGSVCTQLVARGHGPIMVSRGSATLSSATPVVLGVDAEAPAGEAIEFGFAEAAARRVPLHALYATPQDATSGDRAADRLAEALSGWSERYPDVKVEGLVAHTAEPASAILALSRRAGLVVLGPHDQTLPRRLVRGSVADALIHHARCPVVVVHA